MLEKAPLVETRNQPLSKRRRVAAAVATALLLPACVPDVEVEGNEPVVCEPSGGMQEFTFDKGEGEQDAVHAIGGSGPGPDAQCWSEAVESVEKALEATHQYPVPREGRAIEIPARVDPVDPDDLVDRSKQ